MTQTYPGYPLPPQDVPPLRKRIGPGGVIVKIVVAVLAGVAVTLLVHGWLAVATESGGSCGGRHSGACPDGTLVSTGLGTVVAIFAVPVTVRTLLRRPRWLAPFAALAVAGGVFAGQVFWGQLHGSTLATVWQAAPDENSGLATVGAWTDGSTLIRARVDQVTGYAGATGQLEWNYRLPGQAVLCSAGRGTEAHLAALAYATTNDGPCDHVFGLDLRNGRVTWQVTEPADQVETGTNADYLAIGSGVVTVAREDSVTGYDEHTGAQRWTQSPPDGCSRGAVAADHGGLAVDYGCESGYTVVALDPATGRQLWRADRAETDEDTSVTLVAAHPVVLDELLGGPRRTENLLAYDGSGKLTATIAASSVSTPDGPARLDTGGHSFEGAPVQWLWVRGGELIGTSVPDGRGDYLTAFRLSDGKQAWQTPLSDSVVSAGSDGTHVLVVTEDDPSDQLQSVPLTGGPATVIGVTAQNLGEEPELYPVAGGYAVVTREGSPPDVPVEFLRP